MGGAGGMMPTCAAQAINKCAFGAAEDHTAEPLVTVTFGNPAPPGPFAYSPACIKIKAGASVKFSGDMVTYPIEAGPDCTPDTCGGANPIVDAGPVVFPVAGTFPYHSTTGCISGMLGVVFVVP
jgi:plastocyanin